MTTSVNRSGRQLALDGLALLLLFLALELPNRLQWINLQSLGFLPLELMLTGLLLLVPARTGQWLRALLAVLLALGLVFKVADLIVYQIFARPFNPVFDFYLVDDGLRLVNGAFGKLHALLLALALALIFALIFLFAFVVLGRLQNRLQQTPRLALLSCAGATVLWGVLSVTGFARVNHYFTDELVAHVLDFTDSMTDIKAFASTVNEDASANIPIDKLFDKLRGKDVLVIFVESYGRTVFDDKQLAAAVIPTLEQANTQLAFNGLQARTAYLTSPTYGGLSWLAHGTLLSGLWINNQVRYDSLLMSKRPTLNVLFKRAGWRTLGLMPEITAPWPEGKYFGFDQLYKSDNFGYHGLSFDWVTMPDQFVLATLQARERAQPHAPFMAEIALISSHTPWVPLPTLVPWDQVGDGKVFNSQTTAGPNIDEVWASNDRIREQYRKSIEYDINTLASYAIQFGDDNLVMLILGDHQPLPLVTRNSPSHDVPVHIIARDPAVMAALADWHWSEGLVPTDATPVWRMDTLRARFVQAFSSP